MKSEDIKIELSSDSIVRKPIKRLKEKKKPKLRHLAKTKSIQSVTKDEKPKKPEERYKNFKYFVIVFVVLTVAVLSSNISFSSCGLWPTYENNFNKIVYGDEKFCYRKLESLPVFQKLTEQIVSQDDALKMIAASLDLANREKIVQIALTGAVGVGKSLAANIIIEEFKWQRNVISLVFDVSFRKGLEVQAENDFEMVASKLSDCGFNLVVIDDVPITSSNIERISELERRLHRLAKQNLYKTVFIVILKGEMEESHKALLKDFVVVEFNSITEESFKQCIEVHEKRHKVKLTSKDIEELKYINFSHSGCKTLDKKINLIRN